MGLLSCFLFDDFALDEEDLGGMRKVQVVIEGATAPDASGLDSAVVGWRNGHEIRRLARLEEQGDIALERGLIAFDREVIVRLTLHDIAGQFALGQQGIGGDVLSLNVDAIKKRHEHTDFIGLLGLVAVRYGQSADFFWVWHKPVSCPTTLMMCVCRPFSSMALHMTLPSMARL